MTCPTPHSNAAPSPPTPRPTPAPTSWTWPPRSRPTPSRAGELIPNGASAPSSSQINALTAPTAVTRPDDVVSDQRDLLRQPHTGHHLAATHRADLAAGHPDQGRHLRDPASPPATPAAPSSYQVASATVYDSYGRRADTYDPLGHKTHTDYTMANGLTTGTTTTNPLGQTVLPDPGPAARAPVTTDLTPTASSPPPTTTGWAAPPRSGGYNRATTSPANAKFTYQVSASGTVGGHHGRHEQLPGLRHVHHAVRRALAGPPDPRPHPRKVGAGQRHLLRHPRLGLEDQHQLVGPRRHTLAPRC